MSTAFGAQSAWRQLVDLIGRGRAAADAPAIARLAQIRRDVPPPIRAASARALAFATPPAALVAFFAQDDLAIAAPVLRSATLSIAEWVAILPGLSPAGRSVLRHRRDLADGVTRALESFGSVDFVLGAPEPVASEVFVDEPVVDEVAVPVTAAVVETPATPIAEPEPFVIPETIAPVSPFLSIASVAASMPVVAEARRRAEQAADGTTGAATPATPQSAKSQSGTFPIAELVARIDAYQRQRAEAPTPPPAIQPELFVIEPRHAESFRFETDAGGVVRWVEGAARAPLIGLTLDHGALGSPVDGGAAGAFRRRAEFTNARLVVDGTSDAAGQWRITGIPVFDRATGRFTGYRGSARRPRADETAAPAREMRSPAADALRQLAHELRTPTNAIAGFAEMIESQMLGPVPAPYREQAGVIRTQTSSLLTAIDDIDMAARIETHALDLRAGDVPLEPLLVRIAEDLAPLATLRGVVLDLAVADPAVAIRGDDRAVERLIARLLATLVAAGGARERIGVAVRREEGAVVIGFDRPRALAAYAEETLLTIDAESEAERADETGGGPLLGTGFALRLARNLAVELRGSLTIGEQSLTLRLPVAFSADMEQASSN
ncbi:sensor histidine kinase [Sphingomonas glacialis]|uniref:histidine kinase n=2 Tax=Sphingomonas glacialis TaxID=658225 RepID=A0A502G180_9SPHN|nr:HAMP domain-containing sensor histidine kinase [Sphingomonas glacialis]TPG55290.1 sensor histidine kinase [Sphingomonas glacialis]